MYGTQSNSGGSWVKQFLIAFLFINGLCGAVAAGSLFLDKWNNDQVTRLRTNNLQLLKDNRGLRESNKKLTQQLTDRNQRLDTIKTAIEGYKP